MSDMSKEQIKAEAGRVRALHSTASSVSERQKFMARYRELESLYNSAPSNKATNSMQHGEFSVYEPEPEQKWYKRNFSTAIVVGNVVAFAIAGLINWYVYQQLIEDNKIQQMTISEMAAIAKEELQQDLGRGDISQREFEQLTEGMPYATVCRIIGAEGKIQREMRLPGRHNFDGDPDPDIVMQSYEWKGNGRGRSIAVIDFENGRLESKMQFGLE